MPPESSGKAGSAVETAKDDQHAADGAGRTDEADFRAIAMRSGQDL